MLCSVYFLPISLPYHFPFIFVTVLCLFFLACTCYSLQLLISVVLTWIIMYWWFHVVFNWCYKKFCRHLLA